MNLVPILYPRRPTWRRRLLLGVGAAMERPWDFGILLSFGVAAISSLVAVFSLCF